MKKKSVGIIFLTVLIDLVGFGLILPLIPLYGKSFGASGLVNGAIMASYSLMQFLFSPIWGRLSDRIGRRPVLLTSTACACLSYVIFALGSGVKDKPVLALSIILLSRIFAGICGANITVAQAYIADITPPEQRSARMGLVGMAFGLGFILGPVLGALSALYIGVTAPGWTAAALCAVNFIWAFFILAESWKPSVHYTTQRPHLEQWMHTLRAPRLNLLIGVFFLATFCFTCFESTVGFLVERNFKIAEGEDSLRNVLGKVGWLIAYCGLIGALVQGGLMKRLVKSLGEPKLIAASLFMASVGIALLPYLTTWGFLLLGLAVFSIGSSLTRPPVFGMISIMTAAHEQGAVLGVAQGVGSLARIVGPLFALGMFFTGSPAFSVKDIRHFPMFVNKLTQQSDPVSSFVYRRLPNPLFFVSRYRPQASSFAGRTASYAEQIMLTDYPPSGPISNQTHDNVVQALNRIVGERCIYEPGRFQGVSLRPETRVLLKQGPGGRKLARLNRMLLDDAYPGELSRNLFTDPRPPYMICAVLCFVTGCIAAGRLSLPKADSQ